MNGRTLVRTLKRKFALITDQQLANHLGATQGMVSQWRDNPKITPNQIANIVAKAREQVRQNLLTPIVEFFPLDPVDSRGGANYELFSTVRENSSGAPHPFYEGLQQDLKRSQGLYVFYDSRGRALYVGQTKRSTLWSEMKSAFNRADLTQDVYRVQHPQSRKEFVRAAEKLHPLRRRLVQLPELAAYFSAYEVAPDLVDHLEALLVRAFANDLLNVKMEPLA